MSWIGAATDVPPSGTEKVVAFVRDNALTLVAIVVSLVAGVVAILLARRANRLSALQARIAQEKPSIELSMFDIKDIRAFIVAVPLKKGRILAVPVPFCLHNKGERSATDIQLYLRMPKPLSFDNQLGYEYRAPFRELSFSNVDAENFRTLILSIKAIHPRENHICCIQMSLPFETTLKLSKQLTASVAFVLDATVAQKDAGTFSQQFTLEVLDTSELELTEILKRTNRQIAKDNIGPRILKEAFGAQPSSQHIAIVEYSEKNIEADPRAQNLDHIPPPATATIMTGMQLEDGSYIIPSRNVKPFGWH